MDQYGREGRCAGLTEAECSISMCRLSAQMRADRNVTHGDAGSARKRGRSCSKKCNAPPVGVTFLRETDTGGQQAVGGNRLIER